LSTDIHRERERERREKRREMERFLEDSRWKGAGVRCQFAERFLIPNGVSVKKLLFLFFLPFPPFLFKNFDWLENGF